MTWCRSSGLLWGSGRLHADAPDQALALLALAGGACSATLTVFVRVGQNALAPRAAAGLPFSVRVATGRLLRRVEGAVEGSAPAVAAVATALLARDAWWSQLCAAPTAATLAAALLCASGVAVVRVRPDAQSRVRRPPPAARAPTQPSQLALDLSDVKAPMLRWRPPALVRGAVARWPR